MVGRVLGTVDATPLEFWVGVGEGEYLELDDVVALERVLPTGELVKIFGTISQVRARHEGARFDSDVFLIEDGVLPAEVMEAAQVTATRVRARDLRPAPPRTAGAQGPWPGARSGAVLRSDGAQVPGGGVARWRAAVRQLRVHQRPARRPCQHLRCLRCRHQDQLRRLFSSTRFSPPGCWARRWSTPGP